MKSPNEILIRILELDRRGEDPLGFERGPLIIHLPYEQAKPFLKEGVTAETWEPETKTPRELMADYMPFAWEKANDCRGISAYRSLCHYSAWLWLDGNESLAESIREYEFYGKPQLVEICQYLGLDASTWDDGRRVNGEGE